MKEIIYLIVGMIVGYVSGRASQMRQNKSDAGKVINPEQVEKHQENLDKILWSIAPGDEITNDKVENMLGVSNATAERYLNELEHTGKLQQVGRVGQNVTYKKL